MSQTIDWNVPTVGPATPTEMATRTSDSLDALLSKHSGSTRPPYAVAGTEWADTSVTGIIKVMLFDGAADRLLYTVDKTTGLISLPSPQIVLKQSASPTPTAEGDMRWDTDDDALVIGDGAGQKIFRANDWERIAVLSDTGVAAIVQANLGAFKRIRIHGTIKPSATATVQLQLSADNGATFITSASGWQSAFVGEVIGASAADVGSGSGIANGYLTVSHRLGFDHRVDHTIEFFNKPTDKLIDGSHTGVNAAGAFCVYKVGQRGYTANAVACNALRIFPASGVITSCDLTIEGIRG